MRWDRRVGGVPIDVPGGRGVHVPCKVSSSGTIFCRRRERHLKLDYYDILRHPCKVKSSVHEPECAECSIVDSVGAKGLVARLIFGCNYFNDWVHMRYRGCVPVHVETAQEGEPDGQPHQQLELRPHGRTLCSDSPWGYPCEAGETVRASATA